MTSDTAQLAGPVAQAIEHLGSTFSVDTEPTGDGGAIVTVYGLQVGERWTPAAIDLVFEVAFNYPFAPIYPYYTQPGLARSDNGPLPSGLQQVEWRGAPRTQISRRANRWNPNVDTAAGAVLQVQEWLRTI
jgi:hypothetical protein